MPAIPALTVISILMALGTGMLFAKYNADSERMVQQVADKPADGKKGGIDPAFGAAAFMQLALVYLLGGCAFILGYIGWWGGVGPDGSTDVSMAEAFQNRGLWLVLPGYLLGFLLYGFLPRRRQD